MLEKIEIKGYKSIKDISLDLKPINILIGANGVGIIQLYYILQSGE